MLGWGGHVNVLSSAYTRCCYAAEISVVSLLRYMLLRFRDLWHPCYVTCCYAAEISGILATLHLATLQRSLVSLLHEYVRHNRGEFVKDVQRGRSTIKCQALLMLRGPAANNSSQTHWVPGTKMSCYMPKCGNGASSISTRSCLRRLQRCCERSSEKKDAWICPIEIEKKIVFNCSENTISPKHTQIWTSKFATFQVTQMVASLW